MKLVWEGEFLQKYVLEDGPKNVFADEALVSDLLAPVYVYVLEILWPSWHFASDCRHSSVTNATALQVNSIQRWVSRECMCKVSYVLVQQTVFG